MRLAHAGLTPRRLIDELRKLAVVVSPSTTPRVVAADADDDHVLAAALAGRADMIASGHRHKRHLLPLGQHEGIPNVTARQAVEHFRGGRQDLIRVAFSRRRAGRGLSVRAEHPRTPKLLETSATRRPLEQLAV